MIQSKSHHAEGPVAAVGASFVQGCAPEIVLQQSRPRRARQEVWIRQDSSSATEAKQFTLALLRFAIIKYTYII